MQGESPGGDGWPSGRRVKVGACDVPALTLVGVGLCEISVGLGSVMSAGTQACPCRVGPTFAAVAAGRSAPQRAPQRLTYGTA